MVFYRYTGRDPSWIIIACSLAPDLDQIANPVLRRLGIRLLLDGGPIMHGTFHNIAFMVLFGIAVAFLLHPFGLKFLDALFFSMIGFGAHLFEDALVYNPGYPFLWPFSSEVLGFGILPHAINEEYYVRDFFLIANTEVLIIGGTAGPCGNPYPDAIMNSPSPGSSGTCPTGSMERFLGKTRIRVGE